MTDPYDDLDCHYASYTDRSLDPKTFDDYLEVIQMTSKIKDALIRQAEDRIANDLFKILESILQKEVFAELIDTATADDIIFSFRGEASSYLKRPVGIKI